MIVNISGRVSELETGRPVPGVTVEAYDADVFTDDLLGRAKTDPDGRYLVPTKSRTGFFHERPDPYVVLKDGQGRLLKSTRADRLKDIRSDVVIDVPVSCFKLVEAGLLRGDQVPPELGAPAIAPELARWSFPADLSDPIVAEIEQDRTGQPTLLALFATYMRDLRKTADNLAPAYVKLAKLFDLGRTPSEVHGHHYGVALGLRLSAEQRVLSRLDNVIGLLWGAALGEGSPWVGKSFTRLDKARLRGLTGEVWDATRPAYLGINHFNRLDWHAANQISYHALSYWLNLHEAPAEERAAYAYERNGGNFVALRAPSIWTGSPREVFSLNYRWPGLHNRPPLSWLVDEIVEVGAGLYLGQLLFATKRLLSSYDPRRPVPEHAYNHMGYFLLWDQRWNAEARRLFSFLEIPVTAPGLVDVRVDVEGKPPLSSLTLELPAPAVCDDAVFAEVQADLGHHETVLHLLKAYSDELQEKLDNQSPLFGRLQELFNRGRPVRELAGFLRGALVSWHGAGLFDLLRTNALDKAWLLSARYSPWTGKRFDPITPARLAEFTDGYEDGKVPTAWGSNTQSLRTLREKALGKAMELANIWGEPASKEEAVTFGYDLKNFFFIARADTSLNPANAGKRIYQLNYRWPKLRTIVPDCFCIDELVEIADGLYLGQLMYATDWLKPWDPRLPPAEYKYGQFGYFLLMTETWHQVRLRIGFDLENV